MLKELLELKGLLEPKGLLEFPTLADAKRFAQVTFGLSGKWRRFESPMTGYVTYEEVPT